MAGALCAFLLLAGAGRPSCAAPAGKSLTTIFLVAQGTLSDPFFTHSIVLVMNNLAPAPVGIILNRPTPVPVSSLFPDIAPLRHAPARVYFGGPVDFASVWFLFRSPTSPRHSVRVLDDIYLSADARLLHRLLERDRPMEDLRIFIGHAGWAPGQLQAEIRAGDWTVRNADPGAIFDHRSEYPWPPPKRQGHGALRSAALRKTGDRGSGGT